MQYEHSAGVIVFRAGTEREYLLLDYGSHWDFPKGHVEPGETSPVAALRELQEETGIGDARFLAGFMHNIRYFYRRAGERMRKVVTYFVAETSTDQVTLSHEHCGYVWLPYEDALKRLTFKTSQELLAKARAFLDEHESAVRQG